jgi:hypothetical protein
VATESEMKQAAREHDFITQVLMARDMLEPIISGEIERGHCVGGQAAYGATPGKRKTKLDDAVRIAKTVKFNLDRAVNKFDRGE